MKKDWELTPEAFEKFLSWLDPDRERAGSIYEQIRRGLIAIFHARGCPPAEEMADLTINRVARRVQEIAESYVGSREPYFYTVAHHLYLEYLRKETIWTPLPDSFELRGPETDSDLESIFEQLEKCLAELEWDQRRLILDYYAESKQAKIDFRKGLAAKFGVKVENLRLQTFRIRKQLSDCLDKCLD